MSYIAALMTPDPDSLDPEARIESAWKLMHDKRVRHVPVCKGGKLVGLVTQKDLLVNSRNNALLTLPVAEVMVFNVHTVHIDDDARSAAQQMIDRKISCLPVVDDDENLVGIVTDTDFLKMVVELME